MSLDNNTYTNDSSILLIPQDLKGLKYSGYIILNNGEFRIDIQLKEKDVLQDAQVECEWNIANLLKGYEEVLIKKLHQSSSIKEFLVELKVLLENLTSFDNESENTCDTKVLQNLLKEVEEQIGWDRFLKTNEDFTSLKFVYRDAEQRSHQIIIERKVSSSSLACTVDLPIPVKIKENDSLSSIYQKFIKVVDQCQQFWELLKEIDDNCWVLEPEVNAFRCTYRRIALEGSSSIRVDIDPTQPSTFPECRFVGPSSVVDPLKQNLNKNMSLWDDHEGLLENLRNVLHVKFPSKSSVSKENLQVECGICYSYQLGDEIPEKICEDARCAQPFHTSCLFEWMRSLPTFRQSFNIIFGECPYCGKKLTIHIKR